MPVVVWRELVDIHLQYVAYICSSSRRMSTYRITARHTLPASHSPQHIRSCKHPVRFHAACFPPSATWRRSFPIDKPCSPQFKIRGAAFQIPASGPPPASDAVLREPHHFNLPRLSQTTERIRQTTGTISLRLVSLQFCCAYRPTATIRE